MYVGIIHSFSTSAKQKRTTAKYMAQLQKTNCTAAKNAQWQFSFALRWDGRKELVLVTHGILFPPEPIVVF